MFSIKHQKITSRYAKALFDLAEETHALDAVLQDMKLLLRVCKENKDFDFMLMSPVITSVKKVQVLHALFDTHFSELSILFIDLIVRKRREMMVGGIAEQFILLYRKCKGIKTVDLTTAVPLSESEQHEFIRLFKELTQSEVELEENVSPKIIGGYIFSFDNKRYDASIKSKLLALKKDFNLNIYEKAY